MRIYNGDQIKRAINLNRDLEILINDQRQAFIDFSEGLYEMPSPIQLSFHKALGDCHIKAGFKKDDDIFVVKAATGFYQNTKIGLPSGDGVLLIFSQTTGLLQAILCDGGLLTTMRTALAAAVAAQASPWDIKNIGIVGTGQLAVQVLEILKRLYRNAKFFLWGRSLDKTKAAARDEAQICSSIKELIVQTDLVITTTASTAPIILANDVTEPKHIIALGADDIHKQECDTALFAKADAVIVDSRAQAVKFGDAFHAIKKGSITVDNVIELGTAIKDKLPANAKLIVTDLTGIAAQDIALARFVNQRLNTAHKRN